MDKELRRINFFKGFVTTAEDWQKGHDYHIEKRRLQSQFLHSPGVVPGCLDQLRVVAGDNGMSLTIEPGYAIDGRGRDLLLTESVNLPLVSRELTPPCTIYVAIGYDEKPVDRRDNWAGPEFSGFAFIREYPTVSVGIIKPDNSDLIELARIRLEGDGILKSPQNIEEPGPNEIDRRYVRQAGAKITFSGSPSLGVGEYRQGHQLVSPSKNRESSDAGDGIVDIETVPADHPHRLYLANAYPDPHAREGNVQISWSMQSKKTNAGGVEYKLLLENLSERKVNVFYRIYRLA
jgi:hypothetical protein